MIDYNIVKIEKAWENKILIKNLSLDYKLDFFMLIDSNDKEYVNIIENKILDFIIDKISKENTYKDFSISLEKINNVLKLYNSEKKENKYLNILLAVLNDSDFIFSNIWKSSLYLIKDTNETIEITDKKEDKKEFSYISEWNLEHNDILSLWTDRLLKYLSFSDFNDSVLLKNIDKINKNIELILKEEDSNKNIWVLSLKYKNQNYIKDKKNDFKDKVSKFLLKIMDNNFIKFIIAYFKIGQEKVEKKSKFIKNILLILWMIFITIFLFIILSSAINTSVENDNSIKNVELLKQAKKYKTLASNNYSNPDQFNLNIDKAEEIIEELKEKSLYLNDLETLEWQINIIKKAFNWIETWDENNEKLLYKIPEKYKNNLLEVLKLNWKVYLITKKEIIWPILHDKEAKVNKFEDLKEDEFIDSTILGSNIIILTKNWKIIEFRSSWHFSYKDVLWQDTWEAASSVLNYWNNIYLISKDKKQIFKHSKISNNFKKAEPYLKNEDSNSIWNILSIAIDWGFYLLKNDLSIIKMFSSPYRLETISLKNFPENYKINSNNSKVKIIARIDLNYVYILLNNKIRILKWDVATKFFTKTKSLKYLWQIEASSSKIIDIFIEKDWKIDILNENWIYSMSFNENDWKIFVNN